MNIAEEVDFDKEVRAGKSELLKKLYLSLIIILVASLSFGIGRLTGGGEVEPVRIEFNESLTQPAAAIRAIGAGEAVVASKNGTRYYYPHCSGAKRISPTNLVTFPSKEAAENAGLALAANCVAQ